MKITLKLETLVVVLMIHVNVFAQNPTGASTNLCPRVTYRYTSAPTDVNGGSCANLGWICNGCVNSDGTPGNSVIASGVNTNGTLWADVKWNNVSSGAIGTICGNLSVSINRIAQPTMSGPSTVLLCGTSSITLQASASPTTNIIGYVWSISGSGVSPTGLINTAAPQITINYTNWSAGSTLSATVAVGTRNSCGFNTDISPLQTVNVGSISIPAIPRSAWIQLSPGNIDNLQVPFNFSPSVICSTAAMNIINQPSGTSVVWSSANPSALNVDPTGFATRINNFTGAVSVSAIISNACGSNTQIRSIWVGPPLLTGEKLYAAGFYNVNPVTLSPGNTQGFQIDQVPGADTYTWLLPSEFSFFGSGGNSISQLITLPFEEGVYILGCAAENSCGPGGALGLAINISNGGGGGTLLRVSPNPAKSDLKVEFNMQKIEAEQMSAEQKNRYQPSKQKAVDIEYALYDEMGMLVLYHKTKSNEANIDLREVRKGIYILKMKYGEVVERVRVIVDK